jgi:hypothetical protein
MTDANVRFLWRPDRPARLLAGLLVSAMIALAVVAAGLALAAPPSEALQLAPIRWLPLAIA